LPPICTSNSREAAEGVGVAEFGFGEEQLISKAPVASTAENPVKNVFIRIASQLLVLGLAVASRRAMLEKKMFVP
jgi:hypothetical protein